MRSFIVALAAISLSTASMAQKAPANWFNLDPATSSVPGMATETAYKQLKGKPSRTVVVAVIDSGVDYDHDDLKSVMWVNEDEIANNGKDDDGNGYIDDVHGWNFIGGPDGQNVHFDTYEITRVYAKLKPRFDGRDEKSITRAEKADYATYLKVKEDVERNLSEAKEAYAEQAGQSEAIINGIKAIEKALAGKPMTWENVSKIDAGSDINLNIGKSVFEQLNKIGELPETFAALYTMIDEELGGSAENAEQKMKYHYNVDYDTRKLIVKDNYADNTQHVYGNNDVKGTDPMHGTHVAGIIAASRGNSVGMDGVADNVRIMAIRVVPPSGDERDKDIANAIRYAVDNGATVLNMSFGKAYGSNKPLVDAAVQYALANDVLIVHAAGNSNLNIDQTNNFPTPFIAKANGKISKKKRAKNWMEIGAANWKGGKSLPANFSNYGKRTVDVFAPGVQLYATVPGNEYAALSGTSMASPAAAGTAALLRSYFPNLTAEQIKSIMEQSATKVQQDVSVPGEEKTVSMTDLCRTGGTVNGDSAVTLATKTVGKKKKAGSSGRFANRADRADGV
jgi:cell wall-associated protease